VAFYVIYIQEAHPTDLWEMSSNVRDGVLFHSPQSDGERNDMASACVRNLGIRIPALRDGIANATERAYTGWPDRLYLIDRGGRVAFKSAPGPFGFDPTGLAHALERLGT
jgi:Iodothyronine deiodinase